MGKRIGHNCVAGAVLMDSSNAFDFIYHDLVIAKLATYGFSLSHLKLILSYLRDRHGNNLWCTARFHPDHFFNFSIKVFFLFIEKASIHNYADENSLPAWSTKCFWFDYCLDYRSDDSKKQFMINNQQI